MDMSSITWDAAAVSWAARVWTWRLITMLERRSIGSGRMTQSRPCAYPPYDNHVTPAPPVALADHST